MPSVSLPVPHYPQAGNHTCLPACARMVLNYLGQPITENEVAIQLGSNSFGTAGGRLLRLNSPLLSVTYAPLTFALLQQELEQNHPVIVLVSTFFLDYWAIDTAHAIVVIGYEENSLLINDPAFPTAPQKASIDGFLAAWGEFDYLAGIITKK